MNIKLTAQEMEVILTLTANSAHFSEIHDQLWRKVSKEFVRRYDQVRESERILSLAKAGA